MFDVADWNIEPNQKWFVKLSDIGASALVELFNTLADLEAAVNRVAYASVAFGVDVKVTLTADATAPSFGAALSKFNSQLDYHLKITGSDGDATKRFAIGPFTDLPPVEDPLMLSEEVIAARATLEINKGTHSTLRRQMTLESHYPDLDLGDIVTLASTRRVIAPVKNRVEGITFTASIDDRQQITFNDNLETVEFIDFVRQ